MKRKPQVKSFRCFQKAGFKVGLLSTVKILVDAQEYKATHTTPDSLTINKYLKMMNEEGVEFLEHFYDKSSSSDSILYLEQYSGK